MNYVYHRAESKFKLVAESYKILDNPALKQHFDTFTDLTAIGNSERQRHWLKINRPNQLLESPPPRTPAPAQE